MLLQALLVSALKQLGQAVTPARVRRAIENTAEPVHKRPEDTLKYGYGLLQVRMLHMHSAQGSSKCTRAAI